MNSPQLAHNPLLLTTFCYTTVSIAFFNFAGVSVTKEMSATTRKVLESMRTLIIWMVSIAVGWQSFYMLQLLGFVILITGMCIYNDIAVGEYLYCSSVVIHRNHKSSTRYSRSTQNK